MWAGQHGKASLESYFAAVNYSFPKPGEWRITCVSWCQTKVRSNGIASQLILPPQLQSWLISFSPRWKQAQGLVKKCCYFPPLHQGQGTDAVVPLSPASGKRTRFQGKWKGWFPQPISRKRPSPWDPASLLQSQTQRNNTLQMVKYESVEVCLMLTVSQLRPLPRVGQQARSQPQAKVMCTMQLLHNLWGGFVTTLGNKQEPLISPILLAHCDFQILVFCIRRKYFVYLRGYDTLWVGLKVPGVFLLSSSSED